MLEAKENVVPGSAIKEDPDQLTGALKINFSAFFSKEAGPFNPHTLVI